MAEFKEVINQWMRRCEACDENENVKCRIGGRVCDAFYKMRKHINPEFIEQDVMSWAAENPEPVYPTWGEWLMQFDVMGRTCQDMPNPYFAKDKAASPIPADIAQKLGIEPKEG